MIYPNILHATFISRPNRFIAYVKANGRQLTCHVKNTGRCKELLVPETPVVLQYHPQALEKGRKTEYSLIGAYKKTALGFKLVNMDSQAPNQVAWEWLLAGKVRNLRREVPYGSSRFDLAFLQNGIPAYMEVKGVTLEEGGIARFPDAPTERGVKHLMELEQAAADGYLSYVLFVIARKGVHAFEANKAAHPEFAQALAHAAAHGVKVLAYDCVAKPDFLAMDAPVPLI